MKTKKLFFITFTLLCFSFVANAQRGVRIGYIDMEYILENVPEYKEASTQLNGKVHGIKAHTIRIWEKRYELLVPPKKWSNLFIKNAPN